MYICLCRGITDRDIHKAIREGATTVDDLEQQLGAGTGCGGCRDYTARLLENSLIRSDALDVAYAAA
jgi:bacterioferritin-associated ferredoxin